MRLHDDTVGGTRSFAALSVRSMSTDEELTSVMLAIAGLSPECKRVVTLRKVYGWGHDRIASHLGVERAVVEHHLHDCMKALSKAR